MKHFCYAFLLIAFISFCSVAFSQTILTKLPPITVKSHIVFPVKISGPGLFIFEGYAGQKTGCFGLNVGTINHQTCDRFTFEAAGVLPNTDVPLYFIKRSDNKYLSFQMGGAAFVDKMEEKVYLVDNEKIPQRMSPWQRWLVMKISAPPNSQLTNGYAFMLPLVPEQYGYTLKVYDNFTTLGFSADARIDASQSEFYLKEVPKNWVEPSTQIAKIKPEGYLFETIDGNPIDLDKLKDGDHSITGKDNTKLILTLVNHHVQKTRVVDPDGKELKIIIPSEAERKGACLVCHYEGTRNHSRRVCVYVLCKDADGLNKRMGSDNN